MAETKGRPILVTGSYRSGSTWVGKMIAASREVGYIWEPLNPIHDRGLYRPEIEYFNIWVSHHNASRYDAGMRTLLKFGYNPLVRMAGPGGFRNIPAALFYATRYLGYRIEGRRPLLKDPMALFSASWIAETFNAMVVVLIRHPAAFVNSLAKANWRYPFDHFLKQPRLIDEHLSQFRGDIERMAKPGGDIVDEGILLWRLTHHMIAGYQRKHPDWLFVRHEDLSRDPVHQFEPLFQYLGLDYELNVRKYIDDCTRPGNPVERPGEQWPAFARLDSRRNVNRWAERLSQKDIERIREGTADVWPHFFDEADWKNALNAVAEFEGPPTPTVARRIS